MTINRAYNCDSVQTTTSCRSTLDTVIPDSQFLQVIGGLVHPSLVRKFLVDRFAQMYHDVFFGPGI